MTVRQALGALERDGLVRRVVGRSGGTFVSDAVVERPTTSSARGVSAELRRQGLADGVELISVDVEPGRRRAASALELARGERVIVVVRLRLAAGKPLAIERSSLPARLFPDLEDMDLGGSLYDLMAEGFGRRPVRAVERLETVEARPSDARALGIRRGAPVLLVERVGFAERRDAGRVRPRPLSRRSHPNRDRVDGRDRVKDRARAVVIGGGVGGCSILYWLARLGWDDVVLVERADLTSGSTFHSAGLVGQLRSSLALTRMMMNSVDLYRTLEAEVGLETGWREVGSLRLASSPERLEEITRQAGWAKTFGLPLELISAGEAQALFPPMSTDGVLGAAYLPSDGYIDPSQLTFALAEGARRRGAEVYTNTRVTGIVVEHGEVSGVETDRGIDRDGHRDQRRRDVRA